MPSVLDKRYIIMTSIRAYLESGFSVCYYDHDEMRLKEISNQFDIVGKDKFLSLSYKPTGKSFKHYDITVAINPNLATYNDWIVTSQVNVMLDL